MTLREQLILAAIDIIQREGMGGFTIRRVASECGVSCAAPYKHFRDKEDMLLAALDYVNEKWYQRQSAVIEANSGDLSKQLVAVSMEYIRFLAENPHFRALVWLRSDNMTPEQVKEKAEMSSYSKELVSKWCIKSGYTLEQSARKTFAVRSFIYGAVILFDTGELKYSEENLAMVEKCIRREFELD